MATNIRISYPAIPVKAVTLTPSAAFGADENEFNTLYGARHNVGRLVSQQTADLDIDYDLGSGGDLAADHLIIGRADLLAREGLEAIEVRNGPSGGNLVNSSGAGFIHASFIGTPGSLQSNNVGANLDTSANFSAMCWVKPGSTSAGVKTICGAWNTGSDRRNWRFFQDGTQFGYSVANGTVGTVTDFYDTAVTVSTDEIYVLFVTHRTGFGDVVFQVGTVSTGALATENTSSSIFGGITQGLFFTVGGDYPSGSEYDGGVLRCAVWHNILLSTAEREFLFKGGQGRTFQELLINKEFEDNIRDTRDSLKAWWDFDELSDGASSVIRRDKARYQYDLNDPSTVPSNHEVPLVGPQGQDHLQTFSEQTAQEWRVRIKSARSNYPHSKLFLGKSFDPGVEPSNIRVTWEPGETAIHQGQTGVKRLRRTGEPRWSGRIEWEGLTDAAKAEFTEHIGRNWYRHTFWLYTTESDDVFQGVKCINIKLTEPPRLESIETGYHLARIEFEEVL